MSPQLHVETAGSGPDLALLHGWGLHGRVWCDVAGSLARSFTVHAVDLPGHGLSPRVAGGLGGWVAVLADTLPPAHVVGWSLGGQLALALAAARPPQVRSLVLVATTPRFVAAPDWAPAVAVIVFADFAADLRRDPQATLSRFLALQTQGDERARNAARDLRARLGERSMPEPDTLAEALAILAGNDLRGIAGDVTVPALLVHGGRDPLVPAAAVRWLAGALPQAQVQEFPTAAHAPFVSAPEAFADTVTVFVSLLEQHAADRQRRRAGR
ncbi:MAG TPA: pimeloyl-ACP methyl ester esterase BioH [Pelomicrobium sp.]|nr:pimeloyl-ACP methyl ester esterase BioH [Pelomicrobium sp.]